MQLGAALAMPVSGNLTGYGWVGPSFYQLMSTANPNPWYVQTKLWDFQAPILDKQALIAGVGAVLNNAASVITGITSTIDTEYNTTPSTLGATYQSVLWINNSNTIVSWANSGGTVVTWVNPYTNGYQLFTASANSGGGKYLGLTLTGANNVTQIRLIGIEGERTRRW